MTESAIDSENISKPAPDIAKPKGARKPAKKAKPAKRADRAEKPAAKPKADFTYSYDGLNRATQISVGSTVLRTFRLRTWTPPTRTTMKER